MFFSFQSNNEHKMLEATNYGTTTTKIKNEPIKYLTLIIRIWWPPMSPAQS